MLLGFKFVFGVILAFIAIALVIWLGIGLLALLAVLVRGVVNAQDLFMRWQLKSISLAKRTPLKFVFGRFMEKEEKYIIDYFSNVRHERL